MLKFNIWIIVIPSIERDATVESVMESTAKQLKISYDCTYEEIIHKEIIYKEIIYASCEDDKAEEILGNAARSFKQSSLTKHRLKFVSMCKEHYLPINSFLNTLIIRKLKKFFPNFPEINENGLENSQLLIFNKIIDESPLAEITKTLFPLYQSTLAELLELPETLANRVLAKNTQIHPIYISMAHMLMGNVLELTYLKLPNAIPKEMRQILADKAEYFYRKSKDLDYRDGWSDKGLTRFVLLAKLYYHTKDWNQLKDVLANLEPLLKEAEGSPAIMDNLTYINVLEESEMHNPEKSETPVWDTSARLHHPVYVGNYLLQQMERKAREIDGIELD